MATRRLNEDGEDALAGAWRGANKEASLALPDHADWRSPWDEDSQSHNLDDGCQGRDWHHRVHHNAQLAMISVGLVLVNVRNLGYGQQRQKDKAHDSNRRQKPLPAAASAEISLKSCQSTASVPPILHSNVSDWTLKSQGGHASDSLQCITPKLVPEVFPMLTSGNPPVINENANQSNSKHLNE
jgi:hypothetical protein